MKKNVQKCFLCGGNIIHNEIKQSYFCIKCNAEHASEIYSINSSKQGKVKINYPILKIFFALLGALYLLYLTLRIFVY